MNSEQVDEWAIGYLLPVDPDPDSGVRVVWLGDVIERDVYESLRGEVCPRCARRKPPRAGFCRRCDKMLPEKLREQIYLTHTAGFRAAWSKALHVLRQGQPMSTVFLPPKGPEELQGDALPMSKAQRKASDEEDRTQVK
jgi:ribosomal protein L40E